MSLTIVRMNTASSQTSTVLLTLPPLSDYLLNHRLNIENEHASAVNLDHANYRSCHGNVGLAGSHELVYRDILNVANIIDADTHQPLQAIDEQNQSFSAPESPLAQHNSAIDHGDDGAAKIDQTAHAVRRTRKSRHRLRRDYLAERIHVTGVTSSAEFEHQQTPRRYVRFFFYDLGRRGRRQSDGVTHKIER